MSTTTNSSTVRSAIILTLSFILPLLASLYSDRIYAIVRASRLSSTSYAPLSGAYNATSHETPILAQQQNVSSILVQRVILPILRSFQLDASRMLHELQRGSGKWNSNHPRWRLMTSMKAYLHYGEDRTAELDVWRKRYKKLPRSQRSVSCISTLNAGSYL
jgi:hypothetical protein